MIQKHFRSLATYLTSACLLLSPLSNAWAGDNGRNPAERFPTATPIKHIVVIFQENISFDHYFATYPFAKNPDGEPAFRTVRHTPRANNLLSSGLLTENPNSAQPFRLDISQAVTCDQNHNYGAEQAAFHSGLMDLFPEKVGQSSSAAFPCADYGHGTGIVMGYYDGNTVTALWNYAQHFAMSDNHFSTMFGPSTPGALNLIAGYTTGATVNSGNPAGNTANGATANATIIGDARPNLDDCHPAKKTYVTITSGGKNVGDLLNGKHLSWGWFQGGFAPTSVASDGTATCGATSTNLAGTTADYISHHEPFLYFPQTANQHHVRPANGQVIGTPQDTLTNHQYDLADFWTAVANGKLPAVSYLKAKAVADGHPGYSDPLDEQSFVVDTINKLQATPEWKSTAVVILYDDSDGWYDHVMDPIINQSAAADDNLTGPGSCGVTPADGVVGRCGYGPRQPLLIVSPWAKQNYIDHRITDQSSVLRFIEDNWGLGRIGNGSTDAKAGSLFGMFDFTSRDHADRLFLDPQTGQEAHSHSW